MFKSIRKILSILTAFSIAAVCVGYIPPACLRTAAAGASEVAAKAVIDASKLNMLRDYSELTPYDEVTGKGNGISCVPDGYGFMTSVVNRTEGSFTHSADKQIELNADLAQNGAFIFYFKHDAKRTADGKEETAYSFFIPTLVFTKEGAEGNKQLSINASSANRQPVYFISSEDGTVIRNETYNSSTQQAKASDGTYYNEGYWVIPMSAFTNSAADGSYAFDASQTEGYTLTQIKCVYRNINPSNNSPVSATCNYYFDNLAYAEDIEDILGPIISGEKGTDSAVYTYDAGSRYPVYALGPLDTDAAELEKESGQVIRTKDGVKIRRGAGTEGKAWGVNIYDGGRLIYSADIPSDLSEFSLSLDNSAIVRAQLVSEGEAASAVTEISIAGDVREDNRIDILDLIAMKKLSANFSGKYNSDMDGDGVTNGSDIALLKKILLGIDICAFATDIVPIYGSADADYPNYTEKYGVSELHKDDLQFLYQGLTYAYAITADGREEIALIDQNSGDWIDIITGGGTAALYDSNKLELVRADGIKSYEVVEEGDFTRLYVTYSLSGAAVQDAELITTYTFKETAINVSQHISYKSDKYEAAAKNSFIERMAILDYEALDPSVVGKWVYPDNGDYPYQISESTATVMKFDEHHSLYTFLKAEKDNVTVYPPEYPKLNIPLSFDNGKEIDCTVEYALVAATTSGGVEDNYYSMFRGRGSDYAVGVFPASENTENSTMFVGNSIDLNLNVTNLVSKDVNVSLSYSVYDYYGNPVASGMFENAAVSAETSQNRRLHIEGNYGMYYLNLKASSDNYSHIECYPFALLPESDYKYRSTNPFGMTSIADNGVEQDAMTAARLNVKIGTGNYRFVANAKGYQLQAVQHMLENGVKINVQLNMNSIKPWGYKSVEEFVNAIKEYTPKLTDITDSIEIGNEINFSYSEGKEADPDGYAARYIEDMYIPSSEAVRQAGYKYACAGVSACDSNWLNKVLGQTAETWDLMDILSVHPYGHPSMPDLYGNGANPDYKWNVERSLMRVTEAFEKNGSKEWYISETGNTTPPANTLQTDLRTQADYEMRTLVLGHSYGASRIQLYCFYDRAGYRNGYDIADGEMNYGIFYQPDFLGVVKPKPAAAAFAVINAVTDGLQKTEEYGKYTRSDGTLRTFKMTVKNSSDLYVVWSNKYPLPNAVVGKQSDRIPAMPWVNQWQGRYEDVTFDAVSPTVTVTDIMGNTTVYTAKNGKVTISVSGSLLYIRGIE